jgi:hypothetical protein
MGSRRAGHPRRRLRRYRGGGAGLAGPVVGLLRHRGVRSRTRRGRCSIGWTMARGRRRNAAPGHPGKVRAIERGRGSMTPEALSARDVRRRGRRGRSDAEPRRLSPAQAARTRRRDRCWQGQRAHGRGGGGRMGPLRGARDHALRLRAALQGDRDRRGGAPGPGRRRSARHGADAGVPRDLRAGGFRARADLRRGVGAADPARRTASRWPRSRR